MANRTISVGSFSGGIVTDVIGASDSMVDINDGWIPRIGEIRKRGGKQFMGAAISGLKAGAENTDHFAWVGGGNWHVDGTTTLNFTRGLNLSPFAAITQVPIGGGDYIASYGRQIISAGVPQLSPGVSIIGKWGGSLTSIGNLDANIQLIKGSTKVSGTTSAYEVDQYISIGGGLAPIPNAGNRYRIARVDSNDLYLDRPWPFVSSNQYTILGKPVIVELGDPEDVGIAAGLVLETHQDRLFVANFRPQYITSGNTVDNRETLTDRLRWSAVWSENGDGPKDENGAFYGEDLYYPNAFLDVFPGHAGGIMGLHSLGNLLVIIKEGATYGLRGIVSSKGYPTGITLDVIKNDSGCPSFRGSDKTEIGIAWANKRGLWIYNGSQVTNLVDGVIDTMWKDVLGSDFSEIVVSGVNERIIVHSPATSATIIYHTDKNYFTRQTSNAHTNIVVIDNQERSVDTDTNNYVDWATDFTEDLATDSENASTPRLKVQTQPLPADSEPFYQARPNLLLVGGHFESAMQCSIAYGRAEWNELSFDVDGQVSPDSITPLEYGIEPIAYDTTHRIPIGGVASRPAHRFLIEQQDPAQRVRIYGIGVQYLEDFVVDNED